MAVPLHSHEILLVEASLSVECLLWKQRCRRTAGDLFVTLWYVPTPPTVLLWGAVAWQHMGGSQVTSDGSGVQLVMTGSVVVCRERRVSLGSVETKEIQENR